MSGKGLRVFLGTTALTLSIFALTGCPQADNVAQSTGESDLVTTQQTGSSTSAAVDQEDSATGTDTSTSQSEENPAEDGEQTDVPFTPVVGDYDGDQKVSESDIRLLSRSFGSTLAGGDLNADGRVDILDLAILLTLVKE